VNLPSKKYHRDAITTCRSQGHRLKRCDVSLYRDPPLVLNGSSGFYSARWRVDYEGRLGLGILCTTGLIVPFQKNKIFSFTRCSVSLNAPCWPVCLHDACLYFSECFVFWRSLSSLLHVVSTLVCLKLNYVDRLPTT